jgi:hypothetical protein
MDLFFFLELLIVGFFLVMFLRGARLVWGIGLLTATSALLLDTLLGTFGREQLQEQLGFLFYAISGGLFAGAALWLWGLLRPHLAATLPPGTAVPETALRSNAVYGNDDLRGEIDGVDRKSLFDEIYNRLGPEDVRDLIFDVELNENDVLVPQREMTYSIRQLLAHAEQQGKMSAVSLAVERILTPLPPESLPRREKLSATSPRPVLRHFLLAHYSFEDLTELASQLGIDWEQLGASDKKELARNLLLYLERRNRLDELITQLQKAEPRPE